LDHDDRENHAQQPSKKEVGNQQRSGGTRNKHGPEGWNVSLGGWGKNHGFSLLAAKVWNQNEPSCETRTSTPRRKKKRIIKFPERCNDQEAGQ